MTEKNENDTERQNVSRTGQPSVGEMWGNPVRDLTRAFIELRRCLRHLDIDPTTVEIRMPLHARVIIGDAVAEHLSAPWDRDKPRKGWPVHSLLGFRFYS